MEQAALVRLLRKTIQAPDLFKEPFTDRAPGSHLVGARNRRNLFTPRRNLTKGDSMKINAFAKLVTEEEGLKKSISIAQVKEVLRIANDHLDGKLYAAIREEEL